MLYEYDKTNFLPHSSFQFTGCSQYIDIYDESNYLEGTFCSTNIPTIYEFEGTVTIDFGALVDGTRIWEFNFTSYNPVGNSRKITLFSC